MVLHDSVYQLVIRLGDEPAALRYWATFAVPISMLAFAIVLTRRLAYTLRRAERHHEELEIRVSENHVELEDQYQRLREFERDRS